jgi:hypothetical protein
MPKLTVVEAPSAVPVRKAPLSGPREALKALLDQRARAAARIADLERANGRLNEIFQTVVAAKVALDAFEAEAAARMLEWSKASLKKEAPIVDSDAKFKLLSTLNDAQNQAAAANATRTELTASIQREAAASHALEPQIGRVVAEILVETATGPLLDELREAVAIAVAKQVRVKAAFDAVVNIAHGGPHEAMKPVFVMMEAFSETLRLAAAPPAPDGADDRLAWTKLAMALRADPTSEIEGYFTCQIAE